MANPILIQLAMQLASQGVNLGAQELEALTGGMGGAGQPMQSLGSQMPQIPTGQTQYAGAAPQPTPAPSPQPAPAPQPDPSQGLGGENFGNIVAALQAASGRNQPVPPPVAPRGGTYNPPDNLLPLIQLITQGQQQQQPMSALGNIMAGLGG